jgi:hypothetical protein
MGLVWYLANNDMTMRTLTDRISLLPTVQLTQSHQVLDNQHLLSFCLHLVHSVILGQYSQMSLYIDFIVKSAQC